MVTIEKIVRPREEVLTEGVEGRVDVYKAISGEGIEGNAKSFLEVTYLTEPLKEVLGEVKAKLDGKKSSKGVYIFSGGFGSGKSHHVLSIYHIFKSPEIGEKWLKSQDFNFQIPRDVKAVLIQALHTNPDYLWEPIFEALGHKELNKIINRFPTHEDIKKVVGKRPVMIFLDEIEPWFDSLHDEKLEDRNLNFIQNLIEVASNTELKLCVYISILPASLVRSQKIKGKLNRDNVYWNNLYEIKDRDMIVLYRLFYLEDKKTNASQINELVGDFISKYKQAGMFKDKTVDTMKEIEELREKMFNSYPFHPQVLESLFERYGSSATYQRTRGILYLLSSVVRDLYDKKEIILLSDICPEKYRELSKLDSDLAEKAIEDIRKTRELSVKKSEEILTIVFVKSMGQVTSQGASKEDILFGTIDSQTSINDIEAGLMDILNTAPHIVEREGKYILQEDVNPLVLVENEARLLKDKTSITEKISEIIKKEIKIDRVQTACFETDGIDDKNQTKIVFTLVEKDQEELKKIFDSKTYQNRIIFVIPKCKDILKSNGIDMNIARVLAIEEMLPKFDKFKKILENRYEHDMAEIRKKLKEKYGKLIQWQDSITFMPVSIDFDSGKISKKLEELFDLSTFKEKILFLLNKKEPGESLTVRDIKLQFYRTRGFPIVTDENLFKKAVESLVNEEKVVVVSGSEVYRKGKAMMVLRDEYVLAKPDEIPEETGGVEVGPRTTLRLRTPSDTPEEPFPVVTGEETHAILEEKGPTSYGTSPSGGLEQFNVEDLVIEESKPWSLQCRLDSELDETKEVKEISLTLKGNFKGKDMKDVVNEIVEKHEDEIQSMKVSAKVVKND